ncbi:MAG: tetratricopeptide repeat protein [Candidatus Omnitrophota bacterium]|nr:tetratricopeptide repeat protein [Candidatus Omnitrophota bacterium]
MADFLFQLGKKYCEEGNYQQALRELNKALLINPGHKQALKYIELIEEKTGLGKKGIIREKAVIRKKAIAQSLEKAEGKAEEKSAHKATWTGGAWGYPKGYCNFELYSRYYWHNSQFDHEGNIIRWGFNGSYKEILTELKVEYGLTGKVTLKGYFPYKYARWEDDFAVNTTSGLADIWLGGQYRFLDDPLVMAVQLRGKFPAGYDENAIPSLGSGKIDGEVGILSGKSFDPLPCYLKAESGYRARGGEQTDEIPYYFEFGYKAWDGLILKVALDGIEGLGSTGDIEQDYTKWATGLVYNIKSVTKGLTPTESFDLEIGYARTFSGKNAGSASEIIFKIMYGLSF